MSVARVACSQNLNSENRKAAEMWTHLVSSHSDRDDGARRAERRRVRLTGQPSDERPELLLSVLVPCGRRGSVDSNHAHELASESERGQVPGPVGGQRAGLASLLDVLLGSVLVQRPEPAQRGSAYRSAKLMSYGGDGRACQPFRMYSRVEPRLEEGEEDVEQEDGQSVCRRRHVRTASADEETVS